MSHGEFVHCYGIGPGHTPCLVRRDCLRHTAIRDAHPHVPINVKWHYCRGAGEHFIAVKKPELPE